MSKITQNGTDEAEFAKPLYVPIKRRSFFMYAGATAGATALLLAGCKDEDNNVAPPPAAAGLIDVGASDVGVLNYAYALEQLEAAFYAKVLTGTYYTGLTATSGEKQILGDIALHEKAHADFFKAAITAAGATPIKALEPNFDAINFNDRTSVLGAAKTFEDLGVAAYNGAGRYITQAPYLVIAGKIVSVEARHAALIRDLITANSFVASDVVDLYTPGAAGSAIGSGTGSGLEKSKTPTEVLTAANAFLKEGSKLSATKLV